MDTMANNTTTPITSSTFTSDPATTSSSTFIPTSSSSIFSSTTSSTSIPTTSSSFSSSSVALITSTSTPSSSATVITSRVTVSGSSGSATPETITLTSTATPTAASTAAEASSAASLSSAAAASSSSRAAALATSGASSSNGSGLSSGGKIAIAVVVPIVAIAAIVVGLLFLWKRRKAKKSAEEERRKEVEEYGYNPNNDPTLPAVASTYGETQSEMQEDNSGYRGWGATSSTQRKPSTTLGSSHRGAVGLAVSDTTSNPEAVKGNSEGNSGDPLVHSPTNDRFSGGSDTLGAGALGPTGGSNNREINRGPSNASSAYTGHAHSEGSDDDHAPHAGGAGNNYYEDNNYYNDPNVSHGPYGDGTYGGGPPIIRDVQARRNTRIEKPSVFPQQGNAGISQNF